MSQVLAHDPGGDATFANAEHMQVAIIGTGFAGLGMAIKLKQHGLANFVVLEQAGDIGGTWRDNTYPGCACDVQSHLYSFSFAPNPAWSRAFPTQPEIQSYMRQCSDRFGVTPHIRCNTAVRQAIWDVGQQRWQITTSQGQLTADMFIVGNGPLSVPALPAIPGLADFQGKIFHTANWDHTHDFHGERVAVIGSGASAVQVVPHIQPQVEHLTLFQRTPAWIVPRLDHDIPLWRQQMFRMFPFTQQVVRAGMYWRRELGALALVYRPAMLKSFAKIATDHLARQVPDPVVRAQLTPTYTIGCKRILLSDDFYPAVTQPNAEVVTDRIREVRAHSILTEDGTERAVATIICATGFHVTDNPIAQTIIGQTGQSLADAWQTGMQAYLGAAVAGFPNFFLLIGPNTGVGHTSMIYMIESQLTYILACLRMMNRRGIRTVAVRPEVQAAFNAEMQQRMSGTVWTTGCASWYLDANGHNTTLWPGFTFEFRRRTRHFDHANYVMTPFAHLPTRPTRLKSKDMRDDIAQQIATPSRHATDQNDFADARDEV